MEKSTEVKTKQPTSQNTKAHFNATETMHKLMFAHSPTPGCYFRCGLNDFYGAKFKVQYCLSHKAAVGHNVSIVTPNPSTVPLLKSSVPSHRSRSIFCPFRNTFQRPGLWWEPDPWARHWHAVISLPLIFPFSTFHLFSCYGSPLPQTH